MDRRQLIVTGLGAAAAALLPALPSTAHSKEGEAPAAERFLIIPDIMRIERQTVIEDQENNWRTIHYEVMNRWHVVDGKVATIEISVVGSERYENWLRETPPKNGIPPHVSFGGCIVPGKGDPTFKARWEEQTRRSLGHKV